MELKKQIRKLERDNFILKDELRKTKKELSDANRELFWLNNPTES